MSVASNFLAPFRFLPNHRMFSSDLFTVANQMLGETLLAADRRVQSSKRRTQFEELLDLSFPRYCIVKVILNKGDKTTVDGSKKLLPDIHNFYQVLRSGPTNVQVRNISDGTIKTIRKTSPSSIL